MMGKGSSSRYWCGRDADIPWMKPLQATSVLAHSNWKSFVDVAAPSDTAPIVKVKPVGVVWEKCQNEAFPLGLSVCLVVSWIGWTGKEEGAK